MATCVYDNCNTLRREFWQNGKIVAAVSLEFLQQMARSEYEIFFGMMINSEFRHGTIYGDPFAMFENAVQ